MSKKNRTYNIQHLTGCQREPIVKGPKEMVLKAGKERKPC